jgi:hypothetical protein
VKKQLVLAVAEAVHRLGGRIVVVAAVGQV